MLDKVFKAYDIRATCPNPLSEEMARRIGEGAGVFLASQAGATGKPIVVGRDMRKTSPMMADALISGINAVGVNVIDVGLVDTPFTYFAVNHLAAAGAVMTTASHNPPEYNGFKVSAMGAKPVGQDTGLSEIRVLAARASAEETLHAPGASGRGKRESRDLWDAYASHVRAFYKPGSRRLKVVIDASNGMAGTMVPKVFGRQGSALVPGLEIIEMNFDNSRGEFVHEPNPMLPSAIAELQKAVVREKADCGLCFDGDADRCIVIDEKGQPIGCDHLTAWLAGVFLEDAQGSAVVYDLRSSKAVEEAIRAGGGRPLRSRVGHVFMKKLLAQERGVFAGELSGHFYFRDNFNADSGAIAMAAVLSALSTETKPLSSIISAIARYPQSGERNFRIENKDGALAALKAKYGSSAAIDELDGVTVDAFSRSGWWCNVRKSNTEPLLRLNLEAKDRATLDRMLAEISPLLGEPADH